ncbi:ABC transporter ATP-binding protein [Desulfobotulus sp.]|jgi:putative ABC transport system ATP-binding protein|uniref:ABC transporter ATP-binding protein n=1 Tax=Desulfobotulus sp. TaxID=1940337 RepID=UPI002A367D66|nr:ABC transporter ATP-binding protein [Desulfobotulus sp.]MDY0162229.1 ABC transporter ATP-binding protein [Desulfobotulus sp.]
MSEEAIIRLEHVCRQYRRGSETVHALKDISFSLFPGDFVAVVGPSGSGKTTLMNLMGCLDRPSGGRILVHGREVQEESEAGLTRLRRTVIGFVFQQFFLIPTLNVLENVALPSLFTGKKQRERALNLLEKVGLSQRLYHLPGQLSGGEMQRVAIARSLINGPSILLADEPTGNLDSRNAERILELFERLNEEGMTLVMVTHNADLVKQCKAVVRIEDGAMVQA